MANYRVNKKLVSQKVEQAVRKNLKDVERQFKYKIDNTKETLVRYLDQYNISKELSVSNPESVNSTLLPDGNLFSFLGFNKGDTPYQKLRTYIYESIYLNHVTIKSVNMFVVKLRVNLNIPDAQEIDEVTKLPWGEKSWVRGLEFTGFDNFAYYLYSENRRLKNSRSTTGLQIRNKIRSVSSVAPTPYVNSELRKLRQVLKSKSKS